MSSTPSTKPLAKALRTFLELPESSLYVSQQELAELMGLSTRQIRNLTDIGMPRRSVGGKITYPTGACVQWYRDYKRADNKPPDAAFQIDELAGQLYLWLQIAEQGRRSA